MSDQESLKSEIERLEERLMDGRRELEQLRARLPPAPVGEFELQGPDGAVALRDAFEGRDELLVVHNMGSGCAYCTLWADGLNGILPHLQDRAAFLVVSPDSPQAQRAFAESRGWNFRMLSDPRGAFTRAMGFLRNEGAEENPWPGVSGFWRTAGGDVVRTGSSPFGPGDLFCPAWHLFGLLKNGSEQWQPKTRYAAR